MSMFCYQCQETAGGKGCTVRGVCGRMRKLQSSRIFCFTPLKASHISLPREILMPQTWKYNHKY